MASITSSLRTIRNSSSGEYVRDAIIEAITKINEEDHSISIDELEDAMRRGYVIDPASNTQVQLFDSTITKNSKRAITSGAIYSALEQICTILDGINGVKA